MSRTVSVARENGELGWKQGKKTEVTWVKVDWGSWEQMASVKAPRGPGGCVEMQCWPFGRTHHTACSWGAPWVGWWVCADKGTGAGLLRTSKASLHPWHLKSREEKASADAKSPCVELELGGLARPSVSGGTRLLLSLALNCKALG